MQQIQNKNRTSSMIKQRAICIVPTLAWFLCLPLSAVAQTSPPASQHVPLQKSIGQAGTDIVPSLIVMNSRSATLQGGKLTLVGVSPNSIIFADRPVRAAGHALTTHLLEEWSPDNKDSESFTVDPPNATVSVFSKDSSMIRDAVVVLRDPKLEGDRLTFDVDVLEGDLTGAEGPASVFIDRFGVARGGFARGGVAVGPRGGVAAVGGVGRVGYVSRGAWYRGAPVAVGAAVGAAAVGGAAIGAAAARPYPYYGAYTVAPPPPPCGYYPYPPCY
jgi:hypothetical protein